MYSFNCDFGRFIDIYFVPPLIFLSMFSAYIFCKPGYVFGLTGGFVFLFYAPGLVTVCIGLIALAVVFESLKTVHFMMKVHRRLLCCNQPNCKEYANKDAFTVTFRMKLFE